MTIVLAGGASAATARSAQAGQTGCQYETGWCCTGTWTCGNPDDAQFCCYFKNDEIVEGTCGCADMPD
jgi:hypothetical protein